jgi:hypothetical protein
MSYGATDLPPMLLAIADEVSSSDSRHGRGKPAVYLHPNLLVFTAAMHSRCRTWVIRDCPGSHSGSPYGRNPLKADMNPPTL